MIQKYIFVIVLS